MNSNLKVHFVLALVSLLFAINYTVAKIVMPNYMDPLALIALRVPSATILFWAFHYFFGTLKTAPAFKDLGRFLAAAVFGVAINQIFFFKGISLTSPMLGSVIMTSTPIVVLVISFFVLNEKITWFKSIGLLLGASGALLLITSTGIDFSNATFLGNLFILTNAISYSIYLVIIKPLMAKYDALTVIKWVFLFGSFMVIPFGFNNLQSIEWGQFNYTIWTSIAYIIIGPTFLAYLLNLWSLKKVNPSLVGYYIYLQPLFATTIAVIFRGDVLSFNTLIFSIMIFGGVFMVSYTRSKPLNS